MAADHPDANEQAGGLMPVINQTGLPNTIKGKAQRFILRWLAGGIGNPYVRQIRDNLDELDGRSRVNMMLAEEVGRQAITDPVMMERAKARLLGDLHRKQENVEAIAQAAQAKIDADGDAATEAAPASEPTEDWMNTFTTAAEGASSEQLRDRLASVLAGEIKTPGSVSRATIRFVAETETDDLKQFTSVLDNRFGDKIYVPEEWQKGEMLMAGKSSESLALLSTDLNSTITFESNGNGFLFGTGLALVIQGNQAPSKTVSIWTLTRVGKEVANLLHTFDERVTLVKIANELPKDGLHTILLGRMQPTGGTTVNVNSLEVLWSAPIPGTITMPHVANPFTRP